MIITLFHRVRALRLENKRLRHRVRDLERRMADARHCVIHQANINFELYKWHREQGRDVPPHMQITERKDIK